MTQLSTRENPAAITLPRAATSSWAGRFNDFKTLTKPRITLMVLITAAIGYALGVRATGGAWAWFPLVSMLLGTGLSCMGASVFNQVYERDTDRLMERTRDRPLAAGRVGTLTAFGLGVLLSLAGVLILGLATTWLAASISLLTIITYAGVYTPLKRITTLALLIGAVPGALPPLIGYAAAADVVGVGAWTVFIIMFLWQVPHFLAIAWLYRDQYARAGLVMLPVVDPTGRRTFRQIVIGCLMLLPASLLPSYLGICGLVYFFTALLAGLAFLGFGVALVFQPSRSRARALFLASLVYLPVVLTAMVVNLR